MRPQEIEILELIQAQLGASAVKPSDRLVQDLGADSADLVMVVAAIEERFGVVVAEETLPELRTVADLLRLVATDAEG